MAKITLPLRQVNEGTMRRWLPKRMPDTHKGHYGKALLLCGSVGYTGAAELAAKATARIGAGLVFVGVPQSIYPILAQKLTEPMVFPLPDEDGRLSAQACEQILQRLSSCDACLIGCGLGKSEGTLAAVTTVLTNAKCPVVLDADGINVLQGHIDVLCSAACPVIVTPHDIEFARLGGDLSFGRLQAVKLLQRKTGATILLKGHRTLICGEEGCFVNRCGNPGLARGGSGDVLAGIIVGLLAQGMSPCKAAALGAYLHGKTADLCAYERGEFTMLPSDVIDALHKTINY